MGCIGTEEGRKQEDGEWVKGCKNREAWDGSGRSEKWEKKEKINCCEGIRERRRMGRHGEGNDR